MYVLVENGLATVVSHKFEPLSALLRERALEYVRSHRFEGDEELVNEYEAEISIARWHWSDFVNGGYYIEVQQAEELVS